MSPVQGHIFTRFNPSLHLLNMTSPNTSISQPQLKTDRKMSVDLKIIDFDGPDDPLNALNWPFKKKVITTMLYSFCTMGATWASTA
jgi:hypothetical protein